MLIAQGTFPHVCELYCSLGARIHEPITALRVELCSSDDLRQFLHVCRLDVNYVEALILYVEIPQIYT